MYVYASHKVYGEVTSKLSESPAALLANAVDSAAQNVPASCFAVRCAAATCTKAPVSQEGAGWTREDTARALRRDDMDCSLTDVWSTISWLLVSEMHVTTDSSALNPLQQS